MWLIFIVDYLNSVGKSLTVDTLEKMLSLFFGAGAVCVLGPLLVTSPAVPGRGFEELGFEGGWKDDWQSSGQLRLGREGSCYPHPPGEEEGEHWERGFEFKLCFLVSCCCFKGKFKNHFSVFPFLPLNTNDY